MRDGSHVLPDGGSVKRERRVRRGQEVLEETEVLHSEQGWRRLQGLWWGRDTLGGRRGRRGVLARKPEPGAMSAFWQRLLALDLSLFALQAASS